MKTAPQAGKPSSFDEVDRWKATVLNFPTVTGMVALLVTVSEQIYQIINCIKNGCIFKAIYIYIYLQQNMSRETTWQCIVQFSAFCSENKIMFLLHLAIPHLPILNQFDSFHQNLGIMKLHPGDRGSRGKRSRLYMLGFHRQIIRWLLIYISKNNSGKQ